MINKGYRLQLAKLLKLYKEVSTQEAVLVAEADEFEVGTEVFVESEEGMTPAPDGEYTDTVENKIYVVAGGTITEIREKEVENPEENTQETTEENTENMEENSDNGEDANNSADGTDATSEVENEVEALKAENEALKSKVAELEATVSDLEDQIAAYKAKEEETEAPAAEDAEKFSNQKTGNKALDKKLAAAKAILNAVK